MNKPAKPNLKNKSAKIAEQQAEYLWQAVRLFYQQPIALKNGLGSKVWDEDEKEYLDFFGGILTTIIGHSHPALVACLQQQVTQLLHTSPLYANRLQAKFAKMLADITPPTVRSSIFVNSGTEANELAVLAAREYTKNDAVFVLQHSYHGGSNLTKTMTGQHTWRFQSQSAPNIHYTHNGYCYRCPLKLKPETCGTACAQQLENNIKTMSSGKIAAIICEPIQGVGGFITPPKDFFVILKEIAKHYGGVFIADEVQGAFGRTGKHMFSINHWNVEPDIITMAKGIANGIPLGAVTARQEIADAVSAQPGLLLCTFGGNPLSMAAAVTTLETLAKEASPAEVQKKGAVFQAGLEKLQEKYSLIGEVRGKGLMLALELVSNQKEKTPAVQQSLYFLEETKKNGLLVGRGGLYGNVIRIAPPLNTSLADIEKALTLIDRSLAQVQKTL